MATELKPSLTSENKAPNVTSAQSTFWPDQVNKIKRIMAYPIVTNNIRVQINGEKGFNVFQIGETLEGLLEIIPYSKG